MSLDWTADLIEFSRKFGHHVEPLPVIPPMEVRTLRLRLLREEFDELIEALVEGDIPGIAKEGSDLIYVVVGALIAHGIDPRPCWDAVHCANMSKSQDKRGDGKTVKGNGYVTPDIDTVLAEQCPLSDGSPGGWDHTRSGIREGEAR